MIAASFRRRLNRWLDPETYAELERLQWVLGYTEGLLRECHADLDEARAAHRELLSLLSQRERDR
jgi:hypothetical protein